MKKGWEERKEEEGGRWQERKGWELKKKELELGRDQKTAKLKQGKQMPTL